MPNWCTNTASFSHDNSEMIKQIKAAIGQGNLFEEFAPLPGKEWDYFTAIETWGTKWEANAIDALSESDNSIELMFDSAWGPPTKFYDKMTELGFNVDAIYHEPGMCFAGHYTSEDGDNVYEYDFSDENWRDEVDDEDVLDLLEAEFEIHQQWDEEWTDIENEDKDIQQT